jgi:hypothetical protein
MSRSLATDVFECVVGGLVGRARELGRLREALHDARAGHVRTMVVGGPPGFGKTRLMLEVAAEGRAAGAAVMGVACEPGAPALWPWHAVVRSLALPPWNDSTRAAARAALDAVAVHDPLEAPPFGVRDLIAAALRTAAAERPLLLVLDDAHHADARTLEILAFVTRQLAGCPLLALVAHRGSPATLDTLADAPGADALVLRPLSPEQVRELVAHEAGVLPPAYVVEQVVFVSDGVPRTVRQAVRRLEEHGLLDRAAGRWLGDAAGGAPQTAGTRPPEEHVFRRRGDAWALRFARHEVMLGDARGMRDLAELLRRPGQSVHVLELVGGPAPGASVGPMIDEPARMSFRHRLRELEEDLADAERANDVGMAERVRAEIAAITRSLAEAHGLGGRARLLGHGAERARVAVRRRLALAIGRIGRTHPELGEHLRTYVRTGYWCSYGAGVTRPIRWET